MVLEMQFIDPAHQRQVSRRGRLGLVVRRRAGNLEGSGIAGQPAGRGCGRSFSCAQQARLGERAFLKNRSPASAARSWLAWS